MSLYAIYQDIREHGFETMILVIMILKLIDLVPIKINPWASIKKALQNFFVGELPSEIGKIENDISDLKEGQKRLAEEQANSIAKAERYRIIRFDDEMTHGVLHSDDHKEEIMEDIEGYETYCEKRPYIKNHKGKAAMARITDRYNNKLPM